MLNSGGSRADRCAPRSSGAPVVFSRARQQSLHLHGRVPRAVQAPPTERARSNPQCRSGRSVVRSARSFQSGTVLDRCRSQVQIGCSLCFCVCSYVFPLASVVCMQLLRRTACCFGWTTARMDACVKRGDSWSGALL